MDKAIFPSLGVTLYRGDCLAVMPSLADESIDLVLTDPPFGQTEGGSLQQRREAVLGWQDGKGVYRDDNHHSRLIANDGPEANDLFRKSLPVWKRLLKPGGCCCCCGGGGGPDPQFARWSMWLDRVFEYKQMVVLDKGPIGMGWHYRRSYETILVAQKPGAPCKWYDTTGEVENIIRPGHKGIKKIIPAADEHPCAKSVALAMHFIRLHTQEGDYVLDPCAGAGWVAEACVRLNRKFIGIELDPHWFAVMKKRVAGMKKGLVYYE